ncbi:MAG: Uncharacterised protein [Flavobacterium sp. SCGC AAA160-P02]|nr:MAG: Uncharacterised protein [Flavobacterium sp. SCGC AAA160-P02]
MKKLLLLSVFLIFACTSDTKKSDESWLFVHTAKNAQVTNNTTIIMPLTRDIFAFTDRPYRKHLYLNGKQYASLWSTDETNSFKTDPPNAVLTWVDKDEVKEIEVIITNTSFNEGNLTYSIKENSGIVVNKIENVSLFVDFQNWHQVFGGFGNKMT